LTAQDLDTGRAERAKPRRELSRLDTIFFLISAMVVVDTIGAIAIGGGQAFTCWSRCSSPSSSPRPWPAPSWGPAIPDEGGAYVWVRMASGASSAACRSRPCTSSGPCSSAWPPSGRWCRCATASGCRPVLLYSFVGVELPSTAGEEIRDPRRDIPVAVVVIACTVFHLTSRRPT
jgi:hypothetical protein